LGTGKKTPGGEERKVRGKTAKNRKRAQKTLRGHNEPRARTKRGGTRRGIRKGKRVVLGEDGQTPGGVVTTDFCSLVHRTEGDRRQKRNLIVPPQGGMEHKRI